MKGFRTNFIRISDGRYVHDDREVCKAWLEHKRPLWQKIVVWLTRRTARASALVVVLARRARLTIRSLRANARLLWPFST